MTKRFEGATVAISGAGSGLGRDAAMALATEGASTLVLFDRDERGLGETARQIGDAARPFVCDVAVPGEVEHAWRQAGIDGLDVLMTAAGTIGKDADIENCDVEEWDTLFDINVRGTFLMIRHALPALRKRKGCIVTFGSTAGLAGSGTMPAYSSTKGAVVMMTRSVALRHASEGIRANCVCPGSIETPMLEATFEAVGDPAAAQARRLDYMKRYPLGRFGTAHEVTEAALFLASPGAAYLTGVSLPVDGGRLA
jgi:NAD(P)-dependent dehydrogenase (short-subunit alcohol dehydrogenase family)